MMAIGSDFWRSTASSLAFTLSSAKMALFIEEMLEGGLEIGACWPGGGIDGRSAAGTDAARRREHRRAAGGRREQSKGGSRRAAGSA